MKSTMTKSLKGILATAASVLCFSAAAALPTVTFSSYKEVNMFCGQADVQCTQVVEITIGGFTSYQVQYENVQGGSSGPRRGDGDDDASGGI